MSFELIETVEVGAGGAASIEFTSIPQDGTDLVLKVSARETSTGAFRNIQLKINGSPTNLSGVDLTGNGSAVSTGTFLNDIYAGLVANGATLNTFSNVSLYISNYTSAVPKSWSADSVSENNATLSGQAILAGLFDSTSSVASLSVEGSGSLVQYSSASLYKVTA